MLTSIRRILLQPLGVMVISLAAAVFAAGVVVWTTEGGVRLFLLSYYVPISVPFVAFLFDRAGHRARLRGSQWTTDLVVLALSLARAVRPIPFISGHALFLTYSMLSSRSWVAKLTAGAVLLEVAYFKVFQWHDATLLGGMALGVAASLVFRRLQVGVPFGDMGRET